jgi:hypothetical protein
VQGGSGGDVAHATAAHPLADRLVIHTDRELFTISVDKWDRMMTTVLAQRRPLGSGRSGIADE